MKNLVVRIVFVSSVALMLSVGAFAQEILTNQAIVDMIKGGLSAEIVIAKIRASRSSFDTSTPALKALSEAGIPENVVIEMIAEAGKASKSAAAEAKENDKLLSSIPEQGKLTDLLTKTKVYISTDDLKARDIIARELGRTKKFTVVDRVELCEFFITYESWTELVNVSATAVGNTATARENNQLVGKLTVKTFSENTDSGRTRLVYSVRKSKYFVWEDNPAESTTKQFIKDFIKQSALSGQTH